MYQPKPNEDASLAEGSKLHTLTQGHTILCVWLECFKNMHVPTTSEKRLLRDALMGEKILCLKRDQNGSISMTNCQMNSHL